MIEIPGLTPLQRDLCDQIWSMHTQEQLTAWFEGLPQSVAHQAYVMIQMMFLAALEDQPIEDFSDAHKVVMQIKSQL